MKNCQNFMEKIKKNKKIAFLFPGQGSQYVGMGKSFYKKYDFVKDLFREAGEVLSFDLAKLCFNGPFDDLSKAENIQPAILTISVAAFKVYMYEVGVRPDYLVGHSFGELSALVVSGAIDFEDAVRIARCKGKFAVEAVRDKETAMSVIKNLDKKELENNLDKGVVIGVVNTDKQFTISGDEKSVAETEKKILQSGGEFERIKTTAPFHSPLLRTAIPRLRKELLKIKKNKPLYPILSSVTNKFYKSDNDIVNNISNSYVEPVEWYSVFKNLVTKGVDICIEIGPQKVLTNIVKEIKKDINAYGFGGVNDIEDIKKLFDLNKKDKEDLIIKFLKIAVSTRNNSDDDDAYQKEVSRSYEYINKIILDSEENNSEILIKDIKESMLRLKKILDAKKISKNEKDKIWKDILSNYYSKI